MLPMSIRIPWIRHRLVPLDLHTEREQVEPRRVDVQQRSGDGPSHRRQQVWHPEPRRQVLRDTPMGWSRKRCLCCLR